MAGLPGARVFAGFLLVQGLRIWPARLAAAGSGGNGRRGCGRDAARGDWRDWDADQPTGVGAVAGWREERAVLLSDGYHAYAHYATKTGITHAQCWTHTRRNFFEAQTVDPEAASQALALIGELYRVEESIREEKLGDVVAPQFGLENPRSCLRVECGWFAVVSNEPQAPTVHRQRKPCGGIDLAAMPIPGQSQKRNIQFAPCQITGTGEDRHA